MLSYGDLIEKFVYEAVPTPDAHPSVRFEAVHAAVIGTKQRRQGPMPSPEAQVAVRDVLRSVERPERDGLTVFSPWGGSKQEAGAPLDILEFCALKQLRCLREELGAFGWATRFHFRIEDVTDHYLFNRERTEQVEDYTDKFIRLTRAVLPGTHPVAESQMTDTSTFVLEAAKYSPVFFKYLKGEVDASALAEIGWKGAIPAEQKKHYHEAYAKMYPGHDPDWKLAQYFGGTLARVKLGATAVPKTPHVGVTFAHPVPGDPINRPRVYYRTIPERFTHQHKAPWLARGYLRINEDNTVTPRYVEPGVELTPHTVKVAGVEVSTPYALA